jgi:hypothetical protein
MAIMVTAMGVAVTMIVAMRVPEMPPMGPAVIPRAMAIVIVPVRIERERDDGYIDHVDIVRQIDVAVIVEVVQIVGTDPAAVARPCHVAPRVVAETSVNVDTCAVRDRVHDGIFGTRPGAHVDVGSGIASRRQRSGGCCNNKKRSRK